MSRRRLRRRSEKVRRDATGKPAEAPAEVVREASRVERLAYTRTQAAEALGVSRSTFSRRVLPLIETVEMPWGTKLVPIDELERLIAEQRRPARARPERVKRGRPRIVTPGLVDDIRAEREAGRTLRQIATDLNDGESQRHTAAPSGGRQPYVHSFAAQRPDPQGGYDVGHPVGSRRSPRGGHAAERRAGA